MAYFVSGHVPFITGVDTDHIRSCDTPATFGSYRMPAKAESPEMQKRRSVLSLVIGGLMSTNSPRSERSKSSSELCYSISRGSNSIDGDRLSHRYRCEILAISSSDYIAAESECKQMIVEAGGSIVDRIRYPGGFLFDFSYLLDLPIETGDETSGGGHIIVEQVDAFVFDNAKQLNLRKRPKCSKDWQIKSENRLQKRPRAESSSTENNACSHFPHIRRAKEQITVVQFLLEQARQPRYHIDDEADWVTLDDWHE